jgi:histidinol-phosphate aminotransferase
MNARLPVRKAILGRKTYEAPAEGRSKNIRLDFNENTAGCSRVVIRALGRIPPRVVAMYPEYQKPTQRLAKYFGVKPEELLLTNGGDDALRVFFDTFVDAGSSVLICEPTFPMYRYYAEIAGAEIDALRYGSEMEFPLAEVLSALERKPRVLFVANPNNPTGTLLGSRAIERILDTAPDTAVVMDEAYAEFCGETMTRHIRRYPQLFVTRTFSKAAGLAGLRLGAVVGKAESLAFLRRAMPPFPVNLAALVAAEAAIGDRRAIRAYVRGVQRRRRWLEERLEELGVRTYPSAGNFLLASFGTAGEAVFRDLEKAGVLIRERPDCGKGFARITIGTRKEMELVTERIAKVLRAGYTRQGR